MIFDDAVTAAVTGHMNGDHPEDSLLIARAFGFPEAKASKMVGLDAKAGIWSVTDGAGEHELRVEWPSGEISERPEIRREVVHLYKAACEKLGVPAREEHQAPAGSGAHGHGHGVHGHGHPHGATGEEEGGPKSFSQVIRESSWGDHSSSEGSTFMEDIMRGKGTKQDYIDLVAQHYFMYDALEEVSQQLDSDPEFAKFHPADLVRLATLEADLEYLIGGDWRNQIEPVPATAEYAARIREIGAEGWIAGIIAHHYTRYLGDLSGGQMIAKRVSKQHGFDGAGVEFYNFESLGDLAAFKNEYRAGLDRLGERIDEEEQQRMVAEVRRAYAFNTAVFVDMSKEKAAQSA
ncbi:biliverdin-producing heme oxygenase [Leucobacter denitrificans]|nr:biliverdin-producing heme oxygenase [Leucobacter denitrificans]